MLLRIGTPWGEVFPGRIVPDHHDLHQESSNLCIGHAPVFEPNWVCKAVFMNPYGTKKLYKIPFEYYYKYKVSGGELVIAFGEDEEEIIKSAPEHLTFLYSEYLND